MNRGFPALLLSACLGSGALGQQAAQPPVLAFTHVTVIDVRAGRLRPDMTVVITGNRIGALGPTGTVAVPEGARVIEAQGKYLGPGLVETHAHWFAWFGNRSDTLQGAAIGAGVYLANGITTMIDVAGQRNRDEQMLRLRAAVEASGRPAPRIYISGRVDSASVQRSGAKDPGELTRRLLALGVDGIKIHRGLTGVELQAVVAEAHREGRRVYGHTYEQRETGYHDYTRVAIEAGVDGVFHVLGMAPVHPAREPPAPPRGASWQESWLYGASRWLYVDTATADALIARMVDRGTWLQPTLIAEDWTADRDGYRGSPYWKYSPWPREALGLGFPAFVGADLTRYLAAYARMKWFVRRFYEAGGLLVAGTDGLPISGFGMQEELRLLVEAGIPPLGALQAATLNAVRAFGLDEAIGTIEVGQLADLILLDANPLQDIRHMQRIDGVVRNGEYFDRRALDALLAQAERK